MLRDPRAFLWDVRESALAIQAFTKGMNVEAFIANGMAQAAVERKFEIIGEALNQLSKTDAQLAARIPDLPQVVAFRNQLIHGYATVKTETVWSIIETALPELLTVTHMLLLELGSNGDAREDMDPGSGPG